MKEAWKRSDRLSSLLLCPQTFRNSMKLCPEVTPSDSSTTWTRELLYLLATQGWSFQQRFGVNNASCTFTSCKPYTSTRHQSYRKKKKILFGKLMDMSNTILSHLGKREWCTDTPCKDSVWATKTWRRGSATKPNTATSWVYKQSRSGCAWLDCPYCLANVNDEMGWVFQIQQRASKRHAQLPLTAGGAARASWRRERSSLCPTKHWTIHQMIYFLVTLYLMISWAGILSALSIVKWWKNKAAGCSLCLLRYWWPTHFIKADITAEAILGNVI